MDILNYILMFSIMCICKAQYRSKDCRQASPVEEAEDCFKFQYVTDTRKCVHLEGKLCAAGKNKFMSRPECQDKCKSSKPSGQCDSSLDSYECKTFAYNVEHDECNNTLWSERKCFKGRATFNTSAECRQCIRPRYCDAPVTFDMCHRYFWNFFGKRCGMTLHNLCMSPKTLNRFDKKTDCTDECPSERCHQPRLVVQLKTVYYNAVSNSCSSAPHGTTATGPNAFINSPAGNDMCKRCIR